MPACSSSVCSSSIGRPDRTMTEGARISRLLSDSRQCMANEALAKARALASGKACGALCGYNPLLGPQVPASSALLAANANCFSKYQSLEGCVPESIRIQRVQQKTLDMSVDPTDPNTRFSAYARNFPAACPPIPASYINAGQPILQGKNCPLPNKPDNPVLPG